MAMGKGSRLFPIGRRTRGAAVTQIVRRKGRPKVRRRDLLKAGAAVSAALAASPLAAPYIRGARAAAGTTLKVQASWSSGVIGYRTFETWCNSIVERSGGELALAPFAANEISSIFDMADAVAGGVLDGMLWSPIYWGARMPAAAFLTSFPMGLNHPHHFDMFFESYGGTDLARELYAKQGMYFVGHIQQDFNLIHSKDPIRSLDDFKGLKIRMPGGLIAECFAAIGARTVTLPGPDVYSALETGAIEAADFVGPAINYDLGFAEVSNFIVMGPASTPCLHQPVDAYEFSVNLRTWNDLSDRLKKLLTDEVRVLSVQHFTSIQKANIAAWSKFIEAGTTVNRLSEEDVLRFRKVVIPLWFEWANMDKGAARLFKLHLDVMQNPGVAYLTPDDIKSYKLDL
jgi:TRAP-type mannitol/chloroaromatic compound transport system substrate-binding protein